MNPPGFWHNSPERPGLPAKMLKPAAWLWQAAVARRLRLGRRVRLPVPVICVGNVNLGGTGKTPTVIEIITRLIALGRKPHVVSRGYKGSLAGPVRVDPAHHSANEVGDEPVLLSAFAPTWVARDRLAGAKAAHSAGAQVIVLDDGLQNPDLAQDLSILVVDAGVGFGNGLVFPAGPLREPLKNAMSRSDIVLSIGNATEQNSLSRNWPVLRTRPSAQGALEPLPTGMDWQGLRVLAFAGIGRPQKFFDTLRSLGAEVVQTRAFDDHQQLPRTILLRLEAEADQLAAQLVTTEKDAARLPSGFQTRVLTLPVRLKLSDAGTLESALVNLLK
jgi:tetraacyldisaccharide 4'-kinase